ncbi:MAG: ATP-binding protein [Vicinamibacterales bacterium]
MFNRLRHKLLFAFLAATLIPLAAILWASSALMERSLQLVSNGDVEGLARSFEDVARAYYRKAREQLLAEAASGRATPERFSTATLEEWPAWLQDFWQSGEVERFELSEPDGERLHLATRRSDGAWVYTKSLDGVRLGTIARQLQQARSRAGEMRQRNVPRGFKLALLLTAAAIWTCALATVFYVSGRVSQPIQRLTAGLLELAGGKLETRLESNRRDETGQAIDAFNRMAGELDENRRRLIYLTQVASWQLLARKMAHEIKNSLTPIRLTVEEIAARQARADAAFLERAAAIVVDEVSSLERRVRAFSEFASEPDPRPEALDLNGILAERLDLLRAAHPNVRYEASLAPDLPPAWADADQVRGILTNLLENAAEAAGEGGAVLGMTGADEKMVLVEVHDSGPGLSDEARRMLFEPTVSFKKHGMGLGLAISRKNALLSGGDLLTVEGRLGGAGFRLVIPKHRESVAEK